MKAIRQFWRPALGGLATAALMWAVVAGPPSAVSAASGSSPDPVSPGQVILRLRSAADLPAVAADYHLDAAPLDQLTVAPLYLMRILDGTAAETRAAALSLDARVAYAEPNVIGATPDDQGEPSWASGGTAADYQGQWATKVLRLPAAFAVTHAAGVIIAVLDTGIDASHPALTTHLVPGYDFVDNDADPSETGTPGVDRAYGHGTSVAGLASLSAPEAKIMPVRVLDAGGHGDIWRLARGMVWAAAQGAGVINLSLSTHTHTHVTNELIADLATNGRGVVVVAAAGNEGSGQPEFPAAEGGSRVLSVGASTPTDTLATWSNYGSWVRVAAPGVSLWSTMPGGQFASWSGTSMASGLASGEAALVRATYPLLNAQNVIARIANTSHKISGSVPLRIDAGAAVGR
jgi:thermitase